MWKVKIDGTGKNAGTAVKPWVKRSPGCKTTEPTWQTEEQGSMTIQNMTAKAITRDRVNRTTEQPMATSERVNREPVELGMGANEAIGWGKVWDTFKIGVHGYASRFRHAFSDADIGDQTCKPGTDGMNQGGAG